MLGPSLSDAVRTCLNALGLVGGQVAAHPGHQALHVRWNGKLIGVHFCADAQVFNITLDLVVHFTFPQKAAEGVEVLQDVVSQVVGHRGQAVEEGEAEVLLLLPVSQANVAASHVPAEADARGLQDVSGPGPCFPCPALRAGAGRTADFSEPRLSLVST